MVQRKGMKKFERVIRKLALIAAVVFESNLSRWLTEGMMLNFLPAFFTDTMVWLQQMSILMFHDSRGKLMGAGLLEMVSVFVYLICNILYMLELKAQGSKLIGTALQYGGSCIINSLEWLAAVVAN